MNNKTYYTAKEIADELGVNYITILRAINSGKLKAVRVGKLFRVSANDLAAYLSRKAYE